MKKSSVEPARVLETYPYVVDLTRQEYDVKKIVKDLAGHHVNKIMCQAFSHRGWAHYQSNVAFKDPHLGDNDFLREFIEETRKYGIETFAYVSMNGYDNPMSVKHPEWVSKDAEGNKMLSNREMTPDGVIDTAVMCPNSPYVNYLVSIVKEIAANYDVKGFFLDNATFARCYCSYCQNKFRATYGVELPAKADRNDPTWRQYTGWRQEIFYHFLKTIVSAIKDVKDMPVVLNCGGFHFDCGKPEDVAKYFDAIVFEAFVHAAGRPLHKPFWIHGERAKLRTALRKPVWVSLESTGYPFPYSSLPSVELRLRIALVIANGGVPWLAVNLGQGYTPETDPRGMDAIGEIFAFYEKNEEYYEGVEEIEFAGLLYSRQSRERYSFEHPRDRYDYSFLGFYKALTESHIPFGILTEEALTPEGLSRYRVLCIPNGACLSNEQNQHIEEFVNNGGGLVTTYATSLYDEDGVLRDDFGLRDVMHVESLGSKSRSDVAVQLLGGAEYFRILEKHAVTEGLSLGLVVPVWRDVIDVKPLDGAKTLSTVLMPRRDPLGKERSSLEMLGDDTGLPAIVVSEYGRGRAAYFPVQIDSFFWASRRGTPDHRNLLGNAVKWCGKDRLPLITDAPSTVEVSIFNQPSKKRLVIHLVNLSTNLERPIDYVPPIRDIQVKASLPPDSHVINVLSVSTERRLGHGVGNGFVEFTVPEVKEYEVVAVAYK
jgi:hypothetical protein